jgi:hypothetical protein
VSGAVVATRLEVPARIPLPTIAAAIVRPPMKMNDAMASFVKAARVSTPEDMVEVETAVVEAPLCEACEGSMVEGRGKLAGQWACGDVSCSRYGLKQKEAV